MAFRYFGIGIGFNEIRSAVGREAKVDACISIEPQCSVDAFRCPLDASSYFRREVFGRPVCNSDAFLIIGIVFGLFGGDLPCPLTAQVTEFQFPHRQNPQPFVAEYADIKFTSLNVLLGDGGGPEPIVNEGDPLCEFLVRIDDGCLRDPEGPILAQALGTAIRRWCTNVLDKSLPRARIRPRGLHPVYGTFINSR